MSETSSRVGSAGCHATTVSATVRHQTSDASAGCAPSAQGEKPDSGFAAPTAICATNATAVLIASAPSPGASRRWRQACQQAASSTTPTTAATQRCAIWIAAAPKIGNAPSSQSGQVAQAVLASAPRTYAPVSMRTKVPTAAARSSAVHGAPRPRVARAGQWISTASTVSTARSTSAFARCAVTHVLGSSRSTTMPPRTA